MRKTLVSLAVLSIFCNPAKAQSSVTIYGILDVNVAAISTGAATNSHVTQMTSSSATTSFIGFRGTEDLGDGLSAIFVLESQLALDTGVGGGTAFTGTNPGVASLYNLSNYVGLKGNFGKVTFGRHLTSGAVALLNGVAIIDGANTGMVTATLPQGLANDYWNSNQAKFESLEYGGFSLQTNYAFGEVSGDNKAGTNFGGTVTYLNGGFKTVAGMQRDNDRLGHHVDWSVLSASYKTGKFKVTGTFTDVNNSNPPVLSSGLPWRDSKMWSIGGNYLINTQLSVAAQFFNLKENITNTTSKQLVLNADYALSKRTSLYTLITRNHNGKVPISAISGAPASAVNAQSGAVALGIKHLF